MFWLPGVQGWLNSIVGLLEVPLLENSVTGWRVGTGKRTGRRGTVRPGGVSLESWLLGPGGGEERCREGFRCPQAGEEPEKRMASERRTSPRPAFRGRLALGLRPPAQKLVRTRPLPVPSDSG